MGRKKIKKVALNYDRFFEALNYNDLSVRKLDRDSVVGVSEKTIRRALHDKEINPEILDKLGKKLNVDPYWLSGRDMDLFELIVTDKNRSLLEEKMRIENNPYNKIKEEKKIVDYFRHFEEQLLMYNVDMEKFMSLPEIKQNGFKMELDLIIHMLIYKYFPDKASNQEWVELSKNVLSGEKYDKMVELFYH